MGKTTSIITVGLSPAWDITCRGRNLKWGGHQYIEEQTIYPAGKALNVSKALAWLGWESTAAGLWGRNDYRQMLAAVWSPWPLIKVRMTTVAGDTRRNVTIVDTAGSREMHLRNESTLASQEALKRLQANLEKVVRKGSVSVFSGAMPEEKLLDRVVRIIQSCASRGARIVLDTSGRPLRKAVDTGAIWLIKPNVAELRELCGRRIKNDPASLATAACRLLDRVEMILISRGAKGSLLVTKQGIWQARCVGQARVLSTVGCGDYLLAGFLKGLSESSEPAAALKTALKVATAKALGWTDDRQWPQVQRRIPILMKLL